MKKRSILRILLAALALISVVVPMMVYLENRSIEMRNVTHDAQWLFTTLPFLSHEEISLRLSGVDQSPQEFRDALEKQREAIARFDYLNSAPSMSLDLSTATFHLDGGCRIVFSRNAESGISLWRLRRIETP